MRIWSVAPLAAAAFATVGASGGAFADASQRISGPHIHQNLAVYFVHGASAPGAVPLTLQEAMARGKVQVIETGNVNTLQIENSGTEEVFIQAGDIVKGGKQDRVLTVSFILAPKSGRVPIDSFCVEQGRWSARAGEQVDRFNSSYAAMPSRKALMAMAAPPPAAPPTTGAVNAQARDSGDVANKQRKVWDEVAKTQGDLSARLGASVASPRSASSLQLTMENEKLNEARTAYIKAIEAEGMKEGDVIGYIVAINGKMSAASLYPSNGLFRKMWSKQLAAVVTEAIGERTATGTQPPTPPQAPAAKEFLSAAEKGKSHERASAATMRQETRDSDAALYNEARRADGKWVHRSYLAK